MVGKIFLKGKTFSKGDFTQPASGLRAKHALIAPLDF